MNKFLCLVILTFSLSVQAAPKCEESLLGTSFIRLIEVSLADRQLSIEDLQRLALSESPVNPMEGKLSTSANAALHQGFKKVLEDPSLKVNWPEVRSRLHEVLAQLGADAKISETAKVERAKILNPKFVQKITFQHTPISFPRLRALPKNGFMAGAITAKNPRSQQTAQYAEIYRPPAQKTEAVFLGDEFFGATSNLEADIGEGASAPVLVFGPGARSIMIANSKSLTKWQQILLKSDPNKKLDIVTSRIFATGSNCYMAVLSRAGATMPAYTLKFCKNAKGIEPAYTVSPMRLIAPKGSIENFHLSANGDLYLAVTRSEDDGEYLEVFLISADEAPTKVYEDFNRRIKSTYISFFVAEDRTIYLGRSLDATLFVEKVTQGNDAKPLKRKHLWNIDIEGGIGSHRWIEAKDGRVFFATEGIRDGWPRVLTSDVNTKTFKETEVPVKSDLIDWVRFDNDVYKIPYLDDKMNLTFLSLNGQDEKFQLTPGTRVSRLRPPERYITRIVYDLKGEPYLVGWADKNVTIFSLLNEIAP